MAASACSLLRAHLTKKSYAERICSMEDIQKFMTTCYPTLNIDMYSADQVVDAGNQSETSQWAVVQSADKSVLVDGCYGPVKPVKLVFSSDGLYSFQALLTTIKTGNWRLTSGHPTELNQLLDTMLPASGYVPCPGLRNYQAEFGEFVRFHTKNLREWSLPFSRYDSNTCLLWHLPNNVKQSMSSPLFNCCPNCKSLFHELNALKKRAESSSPGHKQKWIDTSCKRPIKYLSPASQKERITRTSKQ